MTESPQQTTRRMWDESTCPHDEYGRGRRWTGGQFCVGCGLPVPTPPSTASAQTPESE